MVRLLRPDGLRVLTAPNADRALDVLEAEGAGVGVVVTDYVMPGMNGADLLRAIRLRWPDATRILATGNADLSGAARAVNEGQVSRLITKPADPNLFREVVASALADSELLLENRRLRQLADEQSSRLGQWNQRLEEVVSQRTADLEKANLCLERGLLDTVRLLLSILERRLPERANRCREVARLAGRLGMRAELAPDMLRRVQVAALIFDIGLIGLPDPIIRQHAGRMPDAARLQFEQHAAIGQMMLSKVEPLAETATWIRHHHERWDGRGYPDRLAGPAIPLPSRIIALADGYLEAVQQEGGTAPRWRSAQRAAGAFDPDLVEALAADVGEVGIQSHVIEFELPVSRLWAGLRLARPITSANKSILISAGTILTTELIARIQALAGSGAVALDGVSVIGSATNSTARPQVPGGRPG
jgi:response regulator RpfG family c-di-GMP phosphodiesterase